MKRVPHKTENKKAQRKCKTQGFYALLAIALLATLFSARTKKDIETVAGSGEPLTLWVYDEGRIEVLTEIGKSFEQEYGIPVEVSLVDLGQIQTQFLLAARGTPAADLAIIPHDKLGAFAENVAISPIDLGDKANLFLPNAIDGFSYGGQLLGLPLSVENIGFFRNVDMVPEAPETWAEMRSIGEALIAEGKTEWLMGFPDATYNAYPFYTSYGGTIFGKNSDGSLNPADIQMANRGMIAGLDLMTQFVKDGLVPETIDWDAAHVMFESGKAPFVMTGPWAINRFKTAKVNYAISAFPKAETNGSNGAPFLGVQGIIVNASSPQILLAKTFVVYFISSEENMQKIYDAEPRPSAMKSIHEIALSDMDSRGFGEAGRNAVPMPSLPEMGYVWDSWVNAAALAFSGQKSPAEALQVAKVQIETQIKENQDSKE